MCRVRQGIFVFVTLKNGSSSTGKVFSQAYGKSSFFHFYEDLFRRLYEKKFEFLIDFNLQQLEACFHIFIVG